MTYSTPCIIAIYVGKTAKTSPIYSLGQTLNFPGVSGPRFHENQHIKLVRLSALHTGRLYLQEIFLVLISVRYWVNARVVVWPEELRQ